MTRRGRQPKDTEPRSEKTTLRLTPTRKKHLNLLADAQDKSLNDVLNQALQRFIEAVPDERWERIKARQEEAQEEARRATQDLQEDDLLTEAQRTARERDLEMARDVLQRAYAVRGFQPNAISRARQTILQDSTTLDHEDVTRIEKNVRPREVDA